MGDIEVSNSIRAPVSQVWEALTDPELIRQYMYGARVVTDWKVGSPIVWRGVLQERPYENKGTLLRVIPNELLEYTHWSSISELEDAPENYAKIACRLTREGECTRLTITIQEKNVPWETSKHMEWGWRVISSGLKRLLEQPGREDS